MSGRSWRRPSLMVTPPKMKHGEADRMAEFSAALGLPLVPWQRAFLNRLEDASMCEQFDEIVSVLKQGEP